MFKYFCGSPKFPRGPQPPSPPLPLLRTIVDVDYWTGRVITRIFFCLTASRPERVKNSFRSFVTFTCLRILAVSRPSLVGCDRTALRTKRNACARTSCLHITCIPHFIRIYRYYNNTYTLVYYDSVHTFPLLPLCIPHSCRVVCMEISFIRKVPPPRDSALIARPRGPQREPFRRKRARPISLLRIHAYTHRRRRRSYRWWAADESQTWNNIINIKDVSRASAWQVPGYWTWGHSRLMCIIYMYIHTYILRIIYIRKLNVHIYIHTHTMLW